MADVEIEGVRVSDDPVDRGIRVVLHLGDETVVTKYAETEDSEVAGRVVRAAVAGVVTAIETRPFAIPAPPAEAPEDEAPESVLAEDDVRPG